MVKPDLLREDIAVLRDAITASDGSNIANWTFQRKVEQLISDFYDDIGELTALRLTDILDLFLIKVLYIDRKSRDAATLWYLSGMLERYLHASELGPGRGFVPYLSDLMEETARAPREHQNRFESFRKHGDQAMFISGVFPASLGRKRRPGRMDGSAFVDRSYFVTMGRHYYELAASEELAEVVSLRPTLLRLARWFDLYVDALNEMSGRYVLGMDMRLIADKMLDAFNRYRESRDPRHLETARKYAALLKLDARQWPALQTIAVADADAGRSGPMAF